MTLVVDASVALRWFIEAPGSQAAAALLADDEPLIAPDLVVAEVATPPGSLPGQGRSLPGTAAGSRPPGAPILAIVEQRVIREAIHEYHRAHFEE